MMWRRMALGAMGWVGCSAAAALAQAVASSTPTAGVAAAQAPIPAMSMNDALTAQEPVALAAPFRSILNGVELRPPAGGRTIEQPGSAEVVRFLYPDRGWDIRLETANPTKNVPLTRSRDDANGGGMLELTLDQITTADPHAEILEQDVKHLPEYDLAVVVARHHVGTDRELLQQAIVRLNDQSYYILQFHASESAAPSTQPADVTSVAGFGAPDLSAEAAARQAFNLTVGTIHLLDRTQLLHEQELALSHTQQLYDVTWNQKRIESSLLPQQVMRVVRGGHDAGYIVELDHPATHADNDGIEVVLRSHVELAPTADPNAPAPTAGGPVVALPGSSSPGGHKVPQITRVDRMSKMFVTFDRRHEDWSTTTRVDDGHLLAAAGAELGNSDKEVHEALDESAVLAHKEGDAVDPKQPPVRELSKYMLSVTDYTKSAAGVPVERQLPPFYLPQALAQLLPRLLPIDHPSNYFFYSWVSDQHEVMARYVDVQGMQSVTLDGQSLRAVVVKDRIGVDGAPTYHYLTKEGRWLGSVTPSQDLEVLASDADTVRRMWPGADLGTAAPAAPASAAQAPAAPPQP